MTGYGNGEAKGAAGIARVEIKTLNHRYFDFSPRLPEIFSPFEEKIKESIQGKIRRGRVNLAVAFEKNVQPQDDLFIDKTLAKRYKALLLELKRALKLSGEIKLEQVLAFPSVITMRPRAENLAKVWPLVKKALENALRDTLRSREKEGKALYRDLSANGKIIECALSRIKKRSPLVINKYRKKLLNELKKPAIGKPALQRLEEDVANFARSCDVSEEITRTQAHINSFEESLRGAETGRKLDFIAQELVREANTIGSKASDFEMQREVVKIKGAIEKIREQVQNVE